MYHAGTKICLNRSLTSIHLQTKEYRGMMDSSLECLLSECTEVRPQGGRFPSAREKPSPYNNCCLTTLNDQNQLLYHIQTRRAEQHTRDSMRNWSQSSEKSDSRSFPYYECGQSAKTAKIGYTPFGTVYLSISCLLAKLAL